MHLLQSSVIGLSALVVLVQSVTITQPSENTVLNPQLDFTIRWTSTAQDPQSLTFTITGAGDFSILQYQEIASNVQTAAGSVVVPANTLGTFGQYKIEARDASTSTVLNTSPGFYLAQGNDQTMSITQNPDASGTVTLPTVSASRTGPDGNSQISVVTNGDGTSLVLSGTVEPSTSVTRTTSSSSTRTTTGNTAIQTTPTQTPNAQIRIGGERNSVVLTMAGLVAGLVALIA